ncbi:MAG: chemotaxis protein CheA [Gammaproteobacteria bacterium]|nr:chemotaxis protein CheA [Gammaproteobacteria bacterium]
MSMDEAKQTFAQESEELLQEMEDALLLMEEAPEDEENLNSVFRAMHTIKGAAGIFGFDHIVAFTHPVETEMDRVRSGERTVDSGLIAILLGCKDHTATLVEQVLNPDHESLPAELQAEGRELLSRLTGDSETSGSSDLIETTAELESNESTEVVPSDNWLISLKFKQDALRNGLDPLSFIRYLGTLGNVIDIITVLHDLPDASAMDAESCYLAFRIVFNSDADKAAIEAVFEFAEDDCEIRILPPHSKQQNYIELLDELPENEVPQLGELLIQVGALTRKELEASLGEQTDNSSSGESEGSERKPLGEILVKRQIIKKEVVDVALKKQEKSRTKAAQESRNIRVDSAKLGQLINLVGELVISGAAMKLMVDRHGLNDVEEVVSNVEHLVEQIRDNALQLRMVQIGETFSRFRRVARDVSNDLGKKIELRITGGESELDKTVVEKINDPLTHLIRNSLDHGIERPEVRKAQGKPAKGTVNLNAYHDSGHIVIEIKDDGAGLDPERIRAKAEAISLVKPDQTLSRQEIFRLAFEPGLSTKTEASKLSGRGVGMDVVKRNIESLRGSVELDSEVGKGTTVTIHLPLTLAIIDGFLVGAKGETYIVPLDMVEECVEMDTGEWEMDDERHYVNLRGEVMPYIHLSEFFGESNDTSKRRRESLVVVRFGRIKAGLVVDELFGEQQTVIKPMGKVFQNIKGISGATVLGSGDIALILDVQGLINLANSQQSELIRHQAK